MKKLHAKRIKDDGRYLVPETNAMITKSFGSNGKNWDLWSCMPSTGKGLPPLPVLKLEAFKTIKSIITYLELNRKDAEKKGIMYDFEGY